MPDQKLFLALAVGCLAACTAEATMRATTAGSAAQERPAPSKPAGGPSSSAIPNPNVLTGSAGSGGSGSPTGPGVPSPNMTGQLLVQTELGQVTCPDQCADVRALAKGGNPPYSFMWDDGSTTPEHHVCLKEGEKAVVRVTDTSIEAAEFGYMAQTVSAEVAASAIHCDAPTVPPPPPRACFVKNPSFEGEPSLPESGALKLPDWDICWGTPDVNPLFASLMPSEGKTYLGGVAVAAGAAESAGAPFCSPLEAGKTVYFSVDVAVSDYTGGQPARLTLWGGASSCSKDELLWTSPDIMDVNMWHTYCVTVTPTKTLPYFVVVPEPVGFAGTYVLVDNLKTRDHCD